jgi:capsular polysaccharide biosynthesis protein
MTWQVWPRWKTLSSRLPAWWPLAGCLLLGLLGGAAHVLLAEREYAASGQVLVSGPEPETALGFAQAYGRVATDGAVLTTAHTDAGVTVHQLRDRVRAATSPDAPLIEITGTAPRPTDAARAANAVARALIAHGNDATPGTGTELALLTEASPNATPVAPSPFVSLVTGSCAGALTGTLILLARPHATPGGDPRTT